MFISLTVASHHACSRLGFITIDGRLLRVPSPDIQCMNLSAIIHLFSANKFCKFYNIKMHLLIKQTWFYHQTCIRPTIWLLPSLPPIKKIKKIKIKIKWTKVLSEDWLINISMVLFCKSKINILKKSVSVWSYFMFNNWVREKNSKSHTGYLIVNVYNVQVKS